jgi:hypothetical protein
VQGLQNLIVVEIGWRNVAGRSIYARGGVPLVQDRGSGKVAGRVLASRGEAGIDADVYGANIESVAK